MSNVRIGPDGSIIKDDVVIESNGRTVIREDGTIETTSVGGHSVAPERMPAFNAPPVSPLERNGGGNNAVSSSNHVETASSGGGGSQQVGRIDQKVIKEKEYDIQILNGRIKNAIPMNMIIATIVLCVIGAFGLYFLFIPAVVTGIIVAIGVSKKRELEAQRERMYAELEALESGKRL